jgi:hypothetical protein
MDGQNLPLWLKIELVIIAILLAILFAMNFYEIVVRNIKYSQGQSNLQRAIEKNDPTMCEEIGALREQCLITLAKNNNDLSLCKKAGSTSCISDYAIRNNLPDVCGEDTVCHAYFAIQRNDPRFCTPGRGDVVSSCLFQLVKANDDIHMCDYNEDLVWRGDCYIKAAEYYEDSTICAQIENADRKRYCYELFKS